MPRNHDDLDTVSKLVAKKEFDEALKILKKTLKTRNNDFRILQLIGLCKFGKRDYSSAKRTFNKILKERPEDRIALQYMGTICERTRKYKDAERFWTKALELDGNNSEILISLIIHYITVKAPDKAKILQERFFEGASDKKAAMYTIAAAFSSSEYFEEAAEILTQMTLLYPGDPQVFSRLGTAYFALGKTEEALHAYNTASKFDEKNPLHYLDIAACFEKLGQVKASYEYCLKAYKIRPDKTCLIKLVNAAIAAQDFVSALKYVKILTASEPENEDYLVNLTNIYKVLGNYSKALDSVYALMDLAPKSVKYKELAAELCTLIGEYDKAKKIYLLIMRKSKPSAELYYKLAYLYEITGDSDSAEKLLGKAIKLNPDYTEAHKDLAVIFMKRRIFDAAKAEIETAYACDPQNPAVIYEYGNYFQMIADRKKADEMYSKIINSPFLNGEKAFNVALNAIELGNLDQAVELLERCMKENLQNPDVIYTLGRVYMLMGKKETAKALFEDAYFLAPGAETANMLAILCLETAEYEKAYGLFKAINVKYPNNIHNLMNLAETALKLNLKDEALEYLHKYTEFYPEDADAIKLLADLS